MPATLLGRAFSTVAVILVKKYDTVHLFSLIGRHAKIYMFVVYM